MGPQGESFWEDMETLWRIIGKCGSPLGRLGFSGIPSSSGKKGGDQEWYLLKTEVYLHFRQKDMSY